MAVVDAVTPPRDAAGSVDRLVVVAGPTGTGKSELAVALAERLDGEVVNADSMQLYRGMDIGTAKLTVEERRGIPHHLLDVLHVTDTASVARFQIEARHVIEAALARGRTPVLVGGSGLYIQAVIDEIAFPATDLAVRARIEGDLVAVGSEALWERLRRLDPDAARAIEPRNGRRIVRALEVIEVTGERFEATFPTPGRPRYAAALFCLDRDTAALDARLAARVRAMMSAGFLAEVRALDAAGLRRGVTARRALGYRQMLDVLDGTATERAAIEATIAATRRYVRRQRSWFRRDPRYRWLDAADPDVARDAARLAAARSVR